MLKSLHISNYALIDSVDIDFEAGFNVITGETGAGKSIMLGALTLLLGGRAETKSMRDASRKSVIEADFVLDGEYPLLREYCRQNDIEWEDGHCLLRRETASAGGRSRAFVNDSPVPLTLLRGVAMHLVDIHSQHQNQLLATPAFQLNVIDALADNRDLLEEYRTRFAALRQAIHSLREAQARIAKSRSDEEYMRFQLEQLDDAALTPGEESDLEHQREVLTNATAIKEALAVVIGRLGDDRRGAATLVGAAAAECDKFESLFGDNEIRERLESVAIELRDIVATLEDADEAVQADPRRLTAIDERLDTIYTLQRKHRVESVEELTAIADGLRRQLQQLDNSEEEIARLKKEARRAKALALETAAEISASRRNAAAALAEELVATATPLGMRNLNVDIRVEDSEMSATGCDKVSFLFSFNKNQPLMPVAGVASGGEISRLMLSIKAIIASRMQLPSIIFDEIDTGVSGDVAGRMGAMMRRMADSLQVIAITHLPAVASKGNSHYKVYKYDDESATHTSVRRLNDSERVDEIALMLAGNPEDESARAAATSLLNAEK